MFFGFLFKSGEVYKILSFINWDLYSIFFLFFIWDKNQNKVKKSNYTVAMAKKRIG